MRARLIFATHRDLGEMVSQGKFREDLYYRINVMRIHAPALQDHREDIPELATHFLRQYSEMYQKSMVCFEPVAMAALESYSWPGKCARTGERVQRAIIVAQDARIKLEDLPQHIQDEGVVSIDDYQPAGSFGANCATTRSSSRWLPCASHNGNKTLAARSLQISRAYLHRLIRVAGSDAGLDSDDSKLESIA